MRIYREVVQAIRCANLCFLKNGLLQHIEEDKEGKSLDLETYSSF